MDIKLLEDVLLKADRLGCSFADIRFQRKDSEFIEIDNRNLKSYTYDTLSGVGVRVVYGGSMGYASTSIVSSDSLETTLENAVRAAKSLSFRDEKPLSTVEITDVNLVYPMKIDPSDVASEQKIEVALEANKSAFTNDIIKAAFTKIGFLMNYYQIISSDGSELEVKTPLIGLSHSSVAELNGKKETVGDGRSLCSGWEFITGQNWNTFTEDLSRLTVDAVKARNPSPGTYPVVVDQDVMGIVLHEALGHACEADGVVAGYSVLRDRVGENVANESVSVYDEGVVEGGYYHPFDDEGVAKLKTTIIEKGVLKGYLHDRKTSVKMGVKSTGNGRLQDFQNIPIVRQTNFYMTGGDYAEDELLEDIDFGFLIHGKGGKGGQVDPGMGTFTFSVGPSRIIRKGQVEELVRGVVISGSVLDALKTVDAVGKDVQIKTSVFGGCGKGGQSVKVGTGGPTTRAQKMIVGGRED